MFKCKVCPRSFKTAAALQQHVKDSHPTMAAPKTRNPSRGGFRGRRQTSGAYRKSGMRSSIGDPAPSRIPPASGDSIIVTGEDRVDNFEMKKDSTLFKEYLVSPGISPRLSQIAKAFQRIKWRSLTAYVTAQASAIISGGYVAGFIMDPEDKSVTVDHLASNRGAVTKKWYETAIIRMTPTSELYYTSPGVDPRLEAPGRFWVISDGKPQSDINVVITFRWTCELSKATVERDANFGFTLEGSIRAYKSNYNLQWKSKGATEYINDCSGAIPSTILGVPGKHFWRVPSFNIEYKEGTGDTGTIIAHFIVYDISDKKFYWSQDGVNIGTTVWQGDLDEQIAVPCGTIFRYAGQGNICRATLASHRQSALPDSSNSSDIVNDLATTLKRLLQVLPVGGELSREDSMELIPPFPTKPQ